MYLLIVILPLLGSFFSGSCGRFLGYRGAALVTTSCVLFSFLCSTIAFYEVALCASPVYIHGGGWFYCELFDASWGFLFDSLTVVMLVVITSISTLVHVYSISYMAGDPHIPRFMSYLSIFTFFMLMLVTGDNFIQMFLGWEGVGLASYLLINFWFTRLQANKSAIKAMLVNRVGDFGLALAIMGIFSIFKTVDFTTVFACAAYAKDQTLLIGGYPFHALTVIGVLLFIGAVGKSAQLGLHTWLPDAMEGPTPVSALIHAATMVTAGVFMISRCSPLFEYAPDALVIVTFAGAMTTFFAATTGLVQNDLKRVIAYSTCSQLGYMILACGISHYSVGVFHLMNHAFFKALLFLSAGSVIHALSDEQDMRKMGGMAQLLPLTYSMMLIGSLSLVGFPFLTGFYSKDLILEVAYSKYTVSGNFAYWLGSACVFMTSYYSFRVLFLTFLAPTNAYRTSVKNTHEASFLLAFPLVVLAFGSIFAGYIAKDMMVGMGTDFWGNALMQHPQYACISEFIPQLHRNLPLILTFSGAVVAYLINVAQLGSSGSAVPLPGLKQFRSLYIFLNQRWLFDKVYHDFISKKFFDFGYEISFKSFDKGLLEVVGPTGIIKTFTSLVTESRKFQSGFVYHYALLMLIGLTLFVTVVGIWSQIDFLLDQRIYFVILSSIVLVNII
uniref:NADH dehydrogenase subunit 5 n=1 Tax=Tetraselmis marina TaxID=41888 RepID=UPI00218206FD|nr:NADH dehydrogenase subunit 5 [Tetraselmis marina]UVF37907.1 NADH dehydrogenase subunit 5 [Tetraselmis marina]